LARSNANHYFLSSLPHDKHGSLANHWQTLSSRVDG
jgi:hypothetical protein